MILIEIDLKLISIVSNDNKSLMISILPFSTATFIGALLMNVLIQNFIEIINFKPN